MQHKGGLGDAADRSTDPAIALPKAIEPAWTSRVAGGVNSNFRYVPAGEPPVFVAAKGARVYDVAGRDYIDYVLGYGPCILGHSPRIIAAAVAEAMATGQLFAARHPAEHALAAKICMLVPSADMVRLCTSGSEAVQLALRLARAVTGRLKIVKFFGHYHGWLDNVYIGQQDAPIEPGATRSAGIETPGQAANVLDDVLLVPWDNPSALESCLHAHGPEIAAVIMEPIMCNAGVRMPTCGYLNHVRACCDTHGVVLIFDEVITGFRVALGGAQDLFKVLPDLTVLGKALGGGLPIGAVAGRARLMDAVSSKSVMHAGTHNGNLVSVAAAIATLSELACEGGRALAALHEAGRRLRDGVAVIGQRRSVPLRTRGTNAVFSLAVEVSGSDRGWTSTTAYHAENASRRLTAALYRRGVRVSARGTLFLSTAHSLVEVAATLDALDDAVTELATTDFPAVL